MKLPDDGQRVTITLKDARYPFELHAAFVQGAFCLTDPAFADRRYRPDEVHAWHPSTLTAAGVPFVITSNSSEKLRPPRTGLR